MELREWLHEAQSIALYTVISSGTHRHLLGNHRLVAKPTGLEEQTAGDVTENIHPSLFVMLLYREKF